VSGVVDHQVRSLRTQMPVLGYRHGGYRGAYWSIRSATGDYGLLDALPFPAARAREPAAIPTRLARLLGADIEDLIRWGRVISDTAMRRWVVGPPVAPPAPGAAGGAAFGPP
jgi:hypothetical protein